MSLDTSEVPAFTRDPSHWFLHCRGQFLTRASRRSSSELETNLPANAVVDCRAPLSLCGHWRRGGCGCGHITDCRDQSCALTIELGVLGRPGGQPVHLAVA